MWACSVPNPLHPAATRHPPHIGTAIKCIRYKVSILRTTYVSSTLATCLLKARTDINSTTLEHREISKSSLATSYERRFRLDFSRGVIYPKKLYQGKIHQHT